MDISRSRFPLELVKIIQLIADCHFVSFDLEFSGIAGYRRNQKKPKLQELYKDVKKAAEQYQILQFGLTIVHEDLITGTYIARPYNFNISPVPAERLHLERIWSFQSGAVDFLVRNGFQFDLPYTTGVRYLSRKDEANMDAIWALKDKQTATINDMPIKDEDVPLINHVRQAFQKWQAKALEDRENYLNIPDISDETEVDKSIPETLNRYQIRLMHQIVRSEFPDFKSTGKGHFIQIKPFDDKREREEKVKQARYRKNDIARATEFRWLVEAMIGGDITNMPVDYILAAFPKDENSGNGDGQDGAVKEFVTQLQAKLNNRRRIVFGHNCFTDLVYLYRCFVGDLPERIEDFQELIRGLFPAVVDTKHMATFGRGWHSTSLQDVEMDLRTEALPQIDVPAEFDRYMSDESYHEAGFDSLITAKIAIKLSAKLERESMYPRQRHMESAHILQNEDEDDQSEPYITPPESVADIDSIIGEIASTVKDAVSTPLAMVNKVFQSSDLASPGHLSEGETGPESDTPYLGSHSDGLIATIESKSSLVAVKENLINWSKPIEIEKVRAAMARSHIADLVIGTIEPKDLHDSIDNDRTSDPITLSDTAEEDQEEQSDHDLQELKVKELERPRKPPLTPEEITVMAEKGELMPRWSNEFWKHFGKKLQVNSCEEGVCRV